MMQHLARSSFFRSSLTFSHPSILCPFSRTVALIEPSDPYLLKLRMQTNLPAMLKSITDPKTLKKATMEHFNYVLFRFFLVRRARFIEQVLDFMEENNVQPETKSYRFLLLTHLKKKAFDQIPECVSRMQERSVPLDEESKNIYLLSLAKLAKIEEMEQEFQQRKAEQQQVSSHVYNAVIEGYMIVKQYSRALELVEEMNQNEVEANVVTYNIMINWYGKHGKIDEAIKLFNHIQTIGIQPNTVTYSGIINALAKNGRMIEGLEWLEKMKQSGVTMNSSPYSTLISSFSKARQYTFVSKLDKMLQEDGIHISKGLQNYINKSLALSGVSLEELRKSQI